MRKPYQASQLAHSTKALHASVRHKAFLQPFVRFRSAPKRADALTSLDTIAERAKRFNNLLNRDRFPMP